MARLPKFDPYDFRVSCRGSPRSVRVTACVVVWRYRFLTPFVLRIIIPIYGSLRDLFSCCGMTVLRGLFCIAYISLVTLEVPN